MAVMVWARCRFANRPGWLEKLLMPRAAGAAERGLHNGREMQLRRLRRVMLEVGLLGLASAGACGPDSAGPDASCEETVHRTFEIATPADAPLQLRIDSCRLDVDACRALCAMMMMRSQLGSNPTSCDVEFRPATVAATATYTVFHGDNGCPIFGFGPAVSAMAAPRSATSRSQGGSSCRV